MGQDLQRRTPGTLSQRPDPSWSTVAVTTLRLWLERHHIVSRPPAGRRRRLVVALSAVVALVLGAGITLAFTETNQKAASPARPSDPAVRNMTPLQQAVFYRLAAAKWVATEAGPGVQVACDLTMCGEAEQAGFPAGRLMVLPTTAPDPLGADLVIATPAIQSQFGTRLASVYAPQIVARFGSGPEEVDVRYLPPGGTVAFDSQLATDRKRRVTAGVQLAGNQNVHAGPAARAELQAGQVDPLIVITLAQLANRIPVKLVAFTDPAPGEGLSVPLRGAEIGAVKPGDLAAILAEFTSQQGVYAPVRKPVIKSINGESVVTVTYGAPSPMTGPGGT